MLLDRLYKGFTIVIGSARTGVAHSLSGQTIYDDCMSPLFDVTKLGGAYTLRDQLN